MDTDSVHGMGHSYPIEKYSIDGYADVTGTNYAIGQDVEHIAAVVLEAKLRTQAAQDAHQTVIRQAIVALSAREWSVRQIASRLGVSKSLVSREARRAPGRAMPQPDIDSLVEAVWNEGLQSKRERLAPREGDYARPLTILLNIESSLAELPAQ